MKVIHSIVTAVALASIGGTACAQLYGISNNNSGTNAIFQINPANGDLSHMVTVTMPGFAVGRCLALTANPVNGQLFAVLQTGTGALTRRLAIVNPTTGVATDVGPLTSQSISSLTFLGTTLYATSGQQGTNTETLFTVNTTNAALAVVAPLGNGNDGEIIASHPNGLLYHSSGNGTALFESINPVGNVVTPIGQAFGECFGLGWHGGLGLMFGSEIQGDLFTVNLATGARTIIGAMTDQTPNAGGVRGLAYVPPAAKVYGICNPFGDATANRIYEINPANADVASIVQVTMPGFTLGRSLSLAADPVGGGLFAVVQTGANSSTRHLVRVNPSTGVCVDIGALSQAIACLTFQGNTLYAVSGAQGTNPETLFTLNTSTAALTVVQALGNGNDGEIIAAHPSGLLYHSSGNATALFESIDPLTHVVTPLGQASGECFGMGWNPGLGLMFGSDIASTLYTVDLATGARTTVGAMSDQLGNPDNRAMAYVATRACGLADVGKQGGVVGADDHLDNNDFIVFIDLFFAHHPAADVGVQGGVSGFDNIWDNNDFIAFIDDFFNAPASCR
jgi:hypothetical protein